MLGVFIMEMINFSWDTFSKTGDIEAYLLYKDMQNNKEEQNGNLKSEGDNN